MTLVIIHHFLNKDEQSFGLDTAGIFMAIFEMADEAILTHVSEEKPLEILRIKNRFIGKIVFLEVRNELRLVLRVLVQVFKKLRNPLFNILEFGGTPLLNHLNNELVLHTKIIIVRVTPLSSKYS